MDNFMTNEKTGFTREEQNGIIILTIYSSDNETVDGFFEELRYISQNTDNDKVYLLVDASFLVVKPYLVRRAITTGYHFTEVVGCTAIIIPKGSDGYVLRSVMRQVTLDPQIRRREFFETREEGLTWLESCKPDSTENGM